jgi:hypothetical protein
MEPHIKDLERWLSIAAELAQTYDDALLIFDRIDQELRKARAEQEAKLLNDPIAQARARLSAMRSQVA